MVGVTRHRQDALLHGRTSCRPTPAFRDRRRARSSARRAALAELGYEIRAFDTIDFTRSMPQPHSIRDEAASSASPAASSPIPRAKADHRATPLLGEGRAPGATTALTAYLVKALPADRNLDGLLTLPGSPTPATTGLKASPPGHTFRRLGPGERYASRRVAGASAEGDRCVASPRRTARGEGQGPRARAPDDFGARELPRVPRGRRRPP